MNFRAGSPSVASGRASERLGSAPKVRQQSRSPTGSGGGSGSGSVVVSAETVTPSRSVSSEPEGGSCVVSATAIASPNSASTSTVTAARIQAKAFGMKQRPGAPAAGQCASSSGAAGAVSVAGSVRGAPLRGACERGRGEPDDAPGQRILEEAGVEQRVHDEREEDGAQADGEGPVGAGDEHERPGRGGEEPG